MDKLVVEHLRKMVKMTGERARIDAKANNTYIVYMTEKGMVKEYADGKVVFIDEEKDNNH